MLTALFGGAGGRIDELLQLDIVEEDDEQAVTVGYLLQERQLALQGDESHEVRIEYQQRTLANVAPNSYGQSREVGLAEVRLLGVECFHQFVDMSWATVGGHEGVEVVGKGEQSGTVLLTHRHIAEGQRGIDGIVEERHSLKGLLHDAAFVDNGKNLLRTLILIHIHHRTAESGGSPPVDRAVVVASEVVADMFELRVMADAAYALDARLLQVLADGHQLVLVQTLERGIDADVAGGGTAVTALDEAETGGDINENVAEGIDATTSGTEGGVK